MVEQTQTTVDDAQKMVDITTEVRARHGKDVMVGVFENTGGTYRWEVTSTDGHIVAIVDANTLEEAKARAAKYFEVSTVRFYVQRTPATTPAATTPAVTTPTAATPAATTTPVVTTPTTTTPVVTKTYPPTWAKRVTDAMAKFTEARKARFLAKAQAAATIEQPDVSEVAECAVPAV